MDIKEAAKVAFDSLQGFYQDAKDPMIEEVEQEGQDWIITLSYYLAKSEYELFSPVKKRDFKTFRIDSVTGQMKAMKMRT